MSHHDTDVLKEPTGVGLEVLTCHFSGLHYTQQLTESSRPMRCRWCHYPCLTDEETEAWPHHKSALEPRTRHSSNVIF